MSNIPSKFTFVLDGTVNAGLIDRPVETLVPLVNATNNSPDVTALVVNTYGLAPKDTVLVGA